MATKGLLEHQASPRGVPQLRTLHRYVAGTLLAVTQLGLTETLNGTVTSGDSK